MNAWKVLRGTVVLVFLAPGMNGSAEPGGTSLEVRFAAQRVIDSFYQDYELGRPDSLAAPRREIEAEEKVRRYLKLSLAVEKFWKTPVTSQMLQAELRRITDHTRFPDRLQRLFARLGNDATLVQESFVRPIVVNRLARDFFASDGRIHQHVRQLAEEVRNQLLTGERDRMAEDASRSITTLATGTGESSSQEEASDRVIVDQAEFNRLRALAPVHVGEIGTVREERDAFVIRMLLDGSEREATIASYVFPKRSWDDWWRETAAQIDETAFVEPAAGAALLPVVQRAALTPCAANDTWSNLGLDEMPEQRTFHAAVWTGSHMLIWGGRDTFSYPSHGLRYDPLTNTWERTSAINAPAARIRATAIWADRVMIVWGGDRGGSVFNTGGRYDPTTDTWLATSTQDAPSPRSFHTAVWTDRGMVVWGGIDNAVNLDTGGIYDPSTDTWTASSTLGAPAPRSGHTAVWTGSRMLVFGGGELAGGRFDPLTNTWEPMDITNSPWYSERNSAVWTGRYMIVWGGFNGNIGARYDPATDTWLPMTTTGSPEGRFAHTAIWTGSRMIVWGGQPVPPFFGALDSGGLYDPENDTWETMSLLNAPFARSGHTAVWTGSRLVVWGGVAAFGENILPSGGQYDPATDSWVPTASTTNAPLPRSGHTAIWTGTHMIVWGGVNLPERPASGGIYDPLIDSWDAMPVEGSPTPRQGHSAVWTGSEMIVWGGAYLGAYDDGGIFQPARNAWRPMSRYGAPSGRQRHSAVWTGSEMIVWGGESLSQTPQQSGGRYDPVTDTWRPVSNVGAPDPRSRHTAVWDGRRMLVWGGANGNGDLCTGASYDPNADTWGSISTSDAPSARTGHTAIWTGARMLVWGGRSMGTPTSSGGAYDPLTDRWSPVSLVGAPSPRLSHTALWTGRRMLVWGGVAFGINWLNTGGLYEPVTDSWSPMSSIGAPAPRSEHGAVWTGNSMLVWGGTPVLLVGGTGGQYHLTEPVDEDRDGFTNCSGDCNDSDPDVHPDKTEECNGRDDNCDGTIDEGLGPGTVTVKLDPTILWPPNHRMVDIHAAVSISGGCPSACATPPSILLTTAASDEPDDANGAEDGNTSGDIQGASLGTSDFDLQLRAERDDTGDGRLYRIGYTVTDCFGDTAVGRGGVFVSHDQRGSVEPLVMDIVPRFSGGAGSSALEWIPVPGATGYSVTRGHVSSIHVVGSFTVLEGTECLAGRMTTTSLSGVSLDENPLPGDAFFYLTEYIKGTGSGHGTESATRELIAGSGNACR